MRVDLYECDDHFGIDFISENMKDAAWLTRLGLNGTAVTYGPVCCARDNGIFDGHIMIKRFKKNSDHVQRGKVK